jgi:hypothetical protein
MLSYGHENGMHSFQKVSDKWLRFVAISCLQRKACLILHTMPMSKQDRPFHPFKIDRHHIASFSKYKIGRVESP